jgi:WD40 repeat protein
VYDTYEKGVISIQQRQLLGHPDEGLTCCSISMDDMFVVVGGAEGSIYSWDVARWVDL